MDGWTFIVDLVKYGAWPVSTVVLGWMFRKPLVGLLGRIRGVETRALSLRLDQEVEQPRAEILFSSPNGDAQDRIAAPETEPGAR
jgi:hypothetical protein